MISVLYEPGVAATLASAWLAQNTLKSLCMFIFLEVVNFFLKLLTWSQRKIGLGKG
jgi:hypothetical protein